MKHRRTLRMADGGLVPGQRPVSPYSLLGLANAASGAYHGAVDATSNAMGAVASRFAPPPGYTPAMQQPMAQAPAAIAAPVIPAAASPGLGGITDYAGGMQGVMQRREAAAGLRDGGVVPGQRNGNRDTVPAMLTPGEVVLPVDTVDAHGGAEAIQKNMIDATHQPVRRTARQGYANGGLVTRPNWTYGDNGPAPTQPSSAVATRPYEPNFTVGGSGADTSASARQPFDVEGTARTVADGVTDVTPKAGAGAIARSVLGKAGAAGAVGMGAYDTVTGLREGNYGQAALGALDTAAGASLATPAAPIGAAWMAGRALDGAGRAAVDHMGTDMVDRIGGGINQGLRSIGLGTNDDAYLMDKAAVNTGAVSPVSGARAPQGAAVSSAQQPTAVSGAEMTVDDGGRDVPGAQGVRRYGNTYTNDGTADAGQVSALPSNEGLERQARANAIYRSIGQDPSDGQGGGSRMSVVPDSQGAELAARNASVHSILGGTGRLQMRQAELDESAREHDLQHSLGMRGQDVMAESARAQHAATLRGQDLTYGATTRGQDMSSATARLQGQMQKMQQDRQYGLDVAKFGQEQAKQNFDIRSKANDDLHGQITNMLPPGPDGKPDTATAARYMTGLNGALEGFQRTLEQRAQAGDTKAAAQLEDIQKRGAAALDQKDIRAFVNGMKTKDLSDQYASGRFNPIGGTGTVDDRPAAGLRKTSDGFLGFGGEYGLVGPDGKLTGATVPSRAVEGEGQFFGGRKRTDLRDFVR